MEVFVTVFVPVLVLCLLIRLIALPIRWFWKLSINSACGFACLWILNTLAVFTNVYFPINAVTVLIAGFLGLPGIIVLALVQLFL